MEELTQTNRRNKVAAANPTDRKNKLPHFLFLSLFLFHVPCSCNYGVDEKKLHY